jgi:prepilin-type N-terminal cleavage/methylation domain-containing protein
MARRGSHGAAAFTLLEVMVTIVVIAILAVLAIPVISKLRERALRVQCAANLRSLHVAANLYIQQNGSWPQIQLASGEDSALQDYANAWVAALEPFGVQRKTWICPAIQNKERTEYSTPETVRIDYFAMPFDDKPTTPHQWPNMFWFAEAGDVHGNGQLMVFADGSIREFKSFAAALPGGAQANQ